MGSAWRGVGIVYFCRMPDRPNLLLITTDQQRFDTIHAAGNPYIRTPNLDWLLESGIHFSRGYTDAPVCAPARATMITGRHYWNNPPKIGHFGQLTVEEGTVSLPEVLTQHGYQTKAVGKMHYHPPRQNFGWEDMEILEDYYREMQRHPEKGIPADTGLGQNQMEPGISTVDESNSLTHWIVDRSIDFLETRDPSRPFCLYTSFSKPHPPFDPCLSYWLQYQNAPVPEPVYGDWSASAEEIPPGWMAPTWNLNGADRFGPELLEDVRRAYYAMITQVDYNLGLLFARLRELDLLENTLIIFTADHGEMLGDHHMGAKTTFLEPSAHVPFLVRPPEGERYEGLRGTSCETLACLADIMATSFGAAQVPKDLTRRDGIDLIEAAKGTASRDALSGTCRPFHCEIEGWHKFIFCEQGGAELLFDLENDPQERENLTESPAHAEILGRLRRRMADRLKKMDSPAVRDGKLISASDPLSRTEARTKTWPGHHHPLNTPHDVMH